MQSLIPEDLLRSHDMTPAQRQPLLAGPVDEDEMEID